MKDDLRRRRIYFGLTLLLQALVFGYLILTRRLPKGHDTQSVFLLQYLFLSHATPGGGALWMPYLAHGVVSTWFANLQAGLLQNVLLLAGGVPSGTPMLPVFYAGLFLEDLILLIGVWRLGGRYYRTPAAQFFVTVAALGSSMWISNLYWNHRLIYAVPLAISLLLDVLDTGSRPKLFLAASLMLLQLTGNAPYIPVLSMLTIGLFLGIHVLVDRKRLRASLPLLRPRPADAAWLAGIALLFVAVTLSIVRGLGSISQYHSGRNPDGSVTLDAFLTYAGGMNPLRYLDLLLGITPSKDYSLYCGLCTVVFAAAAFTRRPGKALLQFSLCFLLLLLFSMGYLSFVGMTGYYAFYPLHFFRYISLASPLVKLFLILIAGFGFDAFAQASPGAIPAGRRLALALSACGLLLLQGVLIQRGGDDPSDPAAAFLHTLRDGLAVRSGGTPILLGFAVGALAMAGLAAGAFSRRGRGVNPALLVPLVLVLHGADLLRWRFQILRDETVRLEEPLYAVQKVTPMPYLPRRTPNEEGSERSRIFGRKIFDAGATSGTIYDYCEPFLHRDPTWSRYFVTQWSPSVDLLLRAEAGRSLSPDEDVPPPLKNLSDAGAKVIGQSRDKLQVFSAAHAAGSNEEIAGYLTRPEFRGDLLFIASPTAAELRLEASALAKDERLAAAPKVLEFGADRLRVEVESPSEAWLLNADAWHPDWTATVDGVPVPVERANLAYKAVRLHPGRNIVEFRFSAPLRRACAVVLGLLSLFWCLVLAAWTLAEFRTGSRAAPPPAGSAAPA